MTAGDFDRAAIALSLALFCPAFTSTARAQSSLGAAIADRQSSPVEVTYRKWLDDPSTARVLIRRVYATAAPNTYQVISIPIPDSLPRNGGGDVEIVPREGFTILGARKWSLPALAGKSRLIVTIGIPSSAPAGIVTAAEARFHVPGTPTVALAIEIEIVLVRDLAVRMHSEPLRGPAGSELVFSYELVNGGNAAEVVETPITVPKGWTARQSPDASVSIKRGESVGRRVRVSVPRNTATGSFFLRLDVVERGTVRSSIPVAIEILDGLLRQAAPGPEILIAVARAVDASGRGGTITSTRISGPLFDSVRVNARFSIGDNAFGPAGVALTRLGSYRVFPSVELSAPFGRLSLGAAGTSLSDLAGLYAYGRGAVLEARRSGWHLLGLGAMSESSPSLGKSQPMLGVRVDVDAGAAQFRSSLSHLRGGDLSRRQLDAASFGASVDAGFGSTLRGEIAHRRFGGGTGTGWSAELERNDPRNSAQLRLTHAPGGSDAFARAVDEILANISQTLSNRFSVSASAWRLSDVTTVFSRLRSRGWGLRPEYRAHSSTTVALEANSTDVRAVAPGIQYGAASAYGSSERRIGASINTNVGRVYARGSVAGGSVGRTIGVESPTALSERSPAIWWNTVASWRGAASEIELEGSMEEKRDLSGAVRRQSTVALRGHHSLSSSPGRGAGVDWEIQKLRGIVARGTTVVHAGISIPITEMFAVKLYSERNPLFMGATGNTPWIFAFRVEHSTRLPMVRSPGSSGYVYRDVNGNRRLDAGEPGMDGVIVRRGGEMAVTDASGRYRLAGDGRTQILVDEGSLPLGWIQLTTGSPDIGVGPTISAEIRFVVAPRSGIETADVDLSGIRAVARDAVGGEWVARMIGPTVAVFEALSPGAYTVELDLSALEEPLILRNPLPILHVDPLEPSFVTVMLDPRPIRMWRGEPSGSQAKAPAGR